MKKKKSSSSKKHSTSKDTTSEIMSGTSSTTPFTQNTSAMPHPGTPGAPRFDGANISEFLGRYNDQCEDAGLTEAERLRRLPRYCGSIIGQYIKNLPEFTQSWGALERVLLVQYRRADSKQRINSLPFLETFKNKPRDEKSDVRQYIWQFTTISGTLVRNGEIPEFTQTQWFLEGLPERIRGKVVKRCKVNRNEPKTMSFPRVKEVALEVIEEKDAVRGFNSSADDREGLSGLVDMLDEVGREVKEPTLDAPAVVPREKKQEEELVEMFKAMTLAAEARVTARLAEQQPTAFSQPGRMVDAGYPREASGRINPSYPPQGGSRYARPYQATVGAAQFSYPPGGGSGRSFYCYYCYRTGHILRECPEFGLDVERGLVHDVQGRMHWGTEGQGGGPIFVRRGTRGMDFVRAQYNSPLEPVDMQSLIAAENARKGKAPEGTSEAAPKPVSILRRGEAGKSGERMVSANSVSVVDFDDSDDEVEDSPSALVGAAQREEKKTPEKWRNPKKVLKSKAVQEKKLATPKTLRAGGYKDVRMEEEEADDGGDTVVVQQDGVPDDQVEEMELDKADTAALKKIGPKVSRKTEKYLDVLRKNAKPRELLERILDCEVPGVTGREIIGCSDAVQKILFKNMRDAASALANTDGNPGLIKAGRLGVSLADDAPRPFVVRSPRIRIKLGDTTVLALVDCGSEA
ncbi:MAG: hypothetical protein ACRYE7_00135, partial [Janthinobacterium lividum]